RAVENRARTRPGALCQHRRRPSAGSRRHRCRRGYRPHRRARCAARQSARETVRADHRRRTTRMTARVVFACSGAADNVAAIPQLAEEFNAEVVALTLDLGQADELEGTRQAALAAGAVRAHVLDTRDEFARSCIAASLGDAPAGYSPGHNVACGLIARTLVEIARIESADLVAHGGGE